MTATDIIQRMAWHFNWPQQIVVPNVQLKTGEADLVVITKAGYLTEVEIKVSLADWKRDAQKTVRRYDAEAKRLLKLSKHEAIFENNIHRRFYFAVPDSLWDAAKDKLSPEELPHWAGVIIVGKRGESVVVKASQLKADKVSPEFKEQILFKAHCRFWSTRSFGTSIVQDYSI